MSNEEIQGVTKMQDSNAGEIIYLFELMKKYNVPCSLDLKFEEIADPFVGITSLPINAEYYYDENDAVVIRMGEDIEMSFEIKDHNFAKSISDCQIDICICNRNGSYAAWFGSRSIPPEGIKEARAYHPPFIDFGIKINDSVYTADSFEKTSRTYSGRLDN